MATATDHIHTYHEARVFSTADIDEQIHALNTITRLRGLKGGWVCGRVVTDHRDGDLAIFFFLENHFELVSQAREAQEAHLREQAGAGSVQR